VWTAVGSDNFNRRSWTHDSELTAAIWDEGGSASNSPDSFAAELRTALAREHLDLTDDQPPDLRDPEALFGAFAECAAALQRWHDGGRRGRRPRGRLRPLGPSALKRQTRWWATPLSRLVYDPDGRPTMMRLRNQY
jgi:phosphatidylserine/phosphatidylglycerophosphate/cardiolipin synthase-like enzyme